MRISYIHTMYSDHDHTHILPDPPSTPLTHSFHKFIEVEWVKKGWGGYGSFFSKTYSVTSLSLAGLEEGGDRVGSVANLSLIGSVHTVLCTVSE